MCRGVMGANRPYLNQRQCRFTGRTSLIPLSTASSNLKVTSMDTARLTNGEVKAFLFGQTLECFDPNSGSQVATIQYLTNFTCRAAMSNGTTDTGRYGFERDLYWTQYTWFRDRGRFHFFLDRVDRDTCQASFEDGARAFLQRVKK